MRLKYIKLSGFKSFVDTTKVAVPNNLVGIVGPNGCGKSNVIDAIRWVMGESSAKNLRGESMDDVIFNGSAVRKPVNKAYVELVFDNSDGKAPGSYAKFAELGIRRELTREGGSKYFINKVKCRRKDIHDIFLGTGLGPRSYSIIEQGMVGRIVESKPDDLRVLIEEAAGISKYKERRRETENRIRHTRDNLSRVEDIIGELETQLRRLKRQANEAERYKFLKEEQRSLDKELKTRRWSALNEQVVSQDGKLTTLKTDFDAQVAEQRGVESRIEAMRSQQVELTETLNEVQARYYSLGGEVANVEQSIQHTIQTRKQNQEEYDRLVELEQGALKHLELDKSRLTSASQSIADLEPQNAVKAQEHDKAKATFASTNEAFQNWQQGWEQINQLVASPEKERDVQIARIQEQDRRIQNITQRAEQVTSTLKHIGDKLDTEEAQRLSQAVRNSDAECIELEQSLTGHDEAIIALRTDLEKVRQQADSVRQAYQENSATLKALLLAESEQQNEELSQWLERNNLGDSERISDSLKVQSGWELAVDTVLSSRTQAVALANEQDAARLAQNDSPNRTWFAQAAQQTPQAARLNAPSLASKVDAGSEMVADWLHGIYVADSLNQAMSLRDQLALGESVVTKQGEWMGAHWSLLGSIGVGAQGVLQREAMIEDLTEQVAQSSVEIEALDKARAETQAKIKDTENQREQQRKEYRAKSQQRTELHNQLGRIEARSSELLSQREQLTAEDQTLHEQLMSAKDEVSAAQKRMEEAKQQASGFEEQRSELSSQRAGLVDQLEAARRSEREAGDAAQATRLEIERHNSSVQSLQESIQRLEAQLAGQSARREQLSIVLADDQDPTTELREKLQELLSQRLTVEKELSAARNKLAEFENDMRSADQERVGFDRQSQVVRDSLEQVRMNRQELLVRRDTISEGLDASEEQMLEFVSELEPDKNVSELEQELEKVRTKLERIGAVNLVAIEEYEQCSERKEYLDKQHLDLTTAMATLESAIHKIDRETKTRFKDTFESLNKRFQDFFPQLFGGGNAYLELTSNDMLDTGVAVMARPPGKRNSTIHLLSGGEKALTAVSLLFAFFELNPAPFCVLDEVDAPLDDANVERYAKLLKQLAEKTQLLFITHNKITMEVADILVGVTMAEAGVSRLIAVDVAEAAAMAVE